MTDLPTGWTAGFDPPSVTGSGSTTLSVVVPASASGNYTLTVTGTNTTGTLHTVSVGLKAHLPGTSRNISGDQSEYRLVPVLVSTGRCSMGSGHPVGRPRQGSSGGRAIIRQYTERRAPIGQQPA